MKIKNWKEFQHFKDRRPPWIKLHRDILERRDINTISDCSFRVLICLWLLASEDKDMEGNLPPVADISFRLRIPEDKISESLKELTHFIDIDDIKTIPPRYQDDVPEEETEKEEEKEEETETPGGEKISLPELKTIYSATFRDMLPTQLVIDRLQWMIDSFDKDTIINRFEGAASAKAKSLNYITNGMKKELDEKDADTEMWADMGKS